MNGHLRVVSGTSKYIGFSIFIIALLLTISAGASAAPYYHELPAYILADLNTGDVLLANNIHLQRAPASITKVMTAVLAIENGDMDDIVTITPQALRVRGHKLLISSGEKIPLGKLLMATVVNSGNDGAQAVAIHIGGSLDGFVAMMNAKAAELGMTDTHFMNPSGMPDDAHYSSAADLAKLAAYAMQLDYFRTIVSTQSVFFPEFGNRKDIVFQSTNRLLDDFPLCDGIKTGFTDDAKYCLAASASYKDYHLIAIVLGAEKNCQWPAAEELLEWGFSKLDPEYSIYSELIDPDSPL